MDHQEQQFNQTMQKLQENTIYRYRSWCITNEGCSFPTAAAKQHNVPISK